MAADLGFLLLALIVIVLPLCLAWSLLGWIERRKRAAASRSRAGHDNPAAP